MPSTVIHVAIAVVLSAGLLGRDWDWRALAVLVAVLVAPEADTVAGWVIDGAHRSLLHTLLVPLVAAGLVYWDTRTRDTSWLRSRWGAWGVRVVWVALFVHLFAHIFQDMAHLEGINPLYPLHDRFLSLDGEIALSTTDGVVQTFVDITTESETAQPTVDAGQGGTTENTQVANPAQPAGGGEGESEPVDRRFPIAVQGWQLYLVVVGAFTLVARRLQTPLAGRDDRG